MPHAPDTKIALFAYSSNIRKVFHKYKYRFYHSLATVLAQIAIEELAKRYPDLVATWQKEAFVFVPVPLHFSRSNWRGFNQSALLAKAIAKHWGVAYCDKFIVRKVETKHQVGLKGAKRRSNLKNAFGITKWYAQRKAQYPKLVLVDDVATTGSTLLECSRTFKCCGATTIHCLTLCG